MPRAMPHRNSNTQPCGYVWKNGLCTDINFSVLEDWSASCWGPVPIKLPPCSHRQGSAGRKSWSVSTPLCQKAACLSVCTGQFSHGNPKTVRLTVNLYSSALLGVSQTQFLIFFFFCSTRLQCSSIHSTAPPVKSEMASLLHSAAEHTLHACCYLFSQINYWLFYLSGTIQL